MLLQSVVLNRKPSEAATEIAQDAAANGSAWLTAELLLDSPFVLFAESAHAAAAELEHRSTRWGIRS